VGWGRHRCHIADANLHADGKELESWLGRGANPLAALQLPDQQGTDVDHWDFAAIVAWDSDQQKCLRLKLARPRVAGTGKKQEGVVPKAKAESGGGQARQWCCMAALPCTAAWRAAIGLSWFQRKNSNSESRQEGAAMRRGTCGTSWNYMAKKTLAEFQ